MLLYTQTLFILLGKRSDAKIAKLEITWMKTR